MGDLYRPYNPNPQKIRVGDCVVRAICKATGQTWDEVFLWLCAFAYEEKDMPTANAVWGRYLRSQGFNRYLIDRDGMTVREFAAEHPEGIYILALDGHVVCVTDGLYWDAWDSGDETAIYYWT